MNRKDISWGIFLILSVVVLAILEPKHTFGYNIVLYTINMLAVIGLHTVFKKVKTVWGS